MTDRPSKGVGKLRSSGTSHRAGVKKFLSISLLRFGKYSSLTLFCLIVLIPIGVVLFASFKTAREYGLTSPLAPPRNWLNFGNFQTAFTGGNMALGFLNTAIILVVSLIFTILIGTMAAYALNRFEFRFRRGVYALFLLAALVPGVTTQVATFQVVNALGLVNTYWAAIILYSGTDVVSIYIFIQFMQSIPRSMDEAATLDGASRLAIYWRVILPLMKPAIATVVVIKGVGIYNEFYIPFLYMPSQSLGVISTSLYRFIGPYGGAQQIIAAGIVIVVLPTLAVFLFLQRYIYSGITQGAVK